MTDQAPDPAVGVYALRSFRWSEEDVSPKTTWLSSSTIPVVRAKVASPLEPYPEPEDEQIVNRWMQEYVPPPVAEKLGWWSDARVRVWRSPSYGGHGGWLDGTCTAACTQKGHEPPQDGCRCGVYGSLSYADLLSQFRGYTDKIVAVIAAQGKTFVGDRGLRTQFARVVAYWTDPDPIRREVAAVQFKDARVYEIPLDMVTDYGIRMLPPTNGGNGYAGGPSWWTDTHDD